MRDTVLSGHDLGTKRVALGLSGRSVAAALGVAPATLLYRERRLDPLSADEARRWQLAISEAARKRSVQLARQGFAAHELPTLLRRELKRG